MNTKMLMLGILLIAGLSFATSYPNNWMTNSVNRYGCNYYYNNEGWGEIGLYAIANDYDGGYWDLDAMGNYLDDMDIAVWGEHTMCYYSGCACSEEEISAINFRSSMLAYNAAAAGYKAKFLAGLRAYLADEGDREAILEDMGEARADYLACLRDALEDGPCDKCD